MQIYLPIAEMSIQAETIATLGVVVGIISGIFGVGGGFLTTPFLIFMGVPPAVAVGTQASQLVASSTTAVLGHWRKRNVDFKMSFVLMCGGFVGTFVGIYIFKMLQHFGQIDLVISILYVVFLCSIGGLMLAESVATLIKSRRAALSDNVPTNQEPTKFELFLASLPYQIYFPQSKLTISAYLPLSIGIFSGLMVSIMGIGAGFILVPAMIYFLKMPPMLVSGTSLVQIIVTSSIACVLHATMNQTVDLILAFILIVGSVIGAQIGVKLSGRIKGTTARVILSLIITIVGIKLASALFIPPINLYSIVVN